MQNARDVGEQTDYVDVASSCGTPRQVRIIWLGFRLDVALRRCDLGSPLPSGDSV